MAIKDRLAAARENLKKIGDTFSALGARIKAAATGSSGTATPKAPTTTTPEVSQDVRLNTQRRDKLQTERDTIADRRDKLKKLDSDYNTTYYDQEVKDKETQIKHLDDNIKRSTTPAKKGFFAGLWDWFKKNVLGLDAGQVSVTTKTTQSNGKLIKDIIIKDQTPDELDTASSKTADKQQTAKNETTKVNLGEGRPLEVSVKQASHPDAGKPGHLFTSTNPDHFTFREISGVSGVQGKEVNIPNKARVVEAIGEIEAKAYKKTAEDMGLKHTYQQGADGFMHHAIVTKEGKPISAEQWSEFKARSVDNFNEISKDVCKDKPFSITKSMAQQPQEQRTFQAEQQAAKTAQAQQAANTPEAQAPSNTSTPSPGASK